MVDANPNLDIDTNRSTDINVIIDVSIDLDIYRYALIRRLILVLISYRYLLCCMLVHQAVWYCGASCYMVFRHTVAQHTIMQYSWMAL